MIVGYIIAALTLAATIGLVVWRVLDFETRWDTSRLSGIWVRFEGVEYSKELLREIGAANRAVCEVLAERYPGEPHLQNYRVIVKPKGTVGSSTHMGGTETVERKLPISSAVHVAIVQSVTAGQFVCHEVARHIVPRRRVGDRDPGHVLVEYADLEFEIKKRFFRDIGGAL